MARAGGLTRVAARGPQRAARIAALLAATAFAEAGAQRPAVRIQPEARADFIDARAAAAHLGIGISLPVSIYARMGLVGAAGQAWRDGEREAAGRVDALVRFVTDPFREARWAPYAAGGIGAMYNGAERWRAVLVGVLGVEGPQIRSVVPALEVGFGGGTRVGMAVRRAMPGRR